MFLFKNGCTFEMNGVSVSVPENYYIDGSPEFTHVDKLSFYPYDKSFEVSYEIVKCEKGTKEKILEYEMCYEPGRDFPPIEEIEHNGLKGHHAIYGSTRNQYYEIRFLIGETDRGNIQFSFYIRTANQDIEEIKSSSELKKLLNGIRKV